MKSFVTCNLCNTFGWCHHTFCVCVCKNDRVCEQSRCTSNSNTISWSSSIREKNGHFLIFDSKPFHHILKALYCPFFSLSLPFLLSANFLSSSLCVWFFLSISVSLAETVNDSIFRSLIHLVRRSVFLPTFFLRCYSLLLFVLSHSFTTII